MYDHNFYLIITNDISDGLQFMLLFLHKPFDLFAFNCIARLIEGAMPANSD